MNATLGLKMLLVTKINQGVEAIDAFDNNITTTSTIAAIGATEGDIFLATESDTAIPTVTAFNENFCFVEKFHDPITLML
jgi:hypothetical protein